MRWGRRVARSAPLLLAPCLAGGARAWGPVEPGRHPCLLQAGDQASTPCVWARRGARAVPLPVSSWHLAAGSSVSCRESLRAPGPGWLAAHGMQSWCHVPVLPRSPLQGSRPSPVPFCPLPGQGPVCPVASVHRSPTGGLFPTPRLGFPESIIAARTRCGIQGGTGTPAQLSSGAVLLCERWPACPAEVSGPDFIHLRAACLERAGSPGSGYWAPRVADRPISGAVRM